MTSPVRRRAIAVCVQLIPVKKQLYARLQAQQDHVTNQVLQSGSSLHPAAPSQRQIIIALIDRVLYSIYSVQLVL